jgi:hypothetical protein
MAVSSAGQIAGSATPRGCLETSQEMLPSLKSDMMRKSLKIIIGVLKMASVCLNLMPIASSC